MSHQKKIMGVFNESITVKMKFEVTMGVCGERPWAWSSLILQSAHYHPLLVHGWFVVWTEPGDILCKCYLAGPLPTHTHCNFKLHFNHDRFIKNTHYFFLVTHITLLIREQAVLFR